MEIIREIQKEIKSKINELDKLQEIEREKLELIILDLVNKLRIEYKNKYRLNMLYNI